MKPSLAVIIPMYNEQSMAAACFDAVLPYVARLKRAKLVVVDDGSTDRTAQTIRAYQKKYPKLLVLATHTRNQGYGAALTTGVRTALDQKLDYGLFMDSDLTNDPAMIPVFASKLGEADCVKASRYIPGGQVSGVSFNRRLVSIIGNTIAAWLFGIGIHDCTNGFRMVRLALLADVHFREKKFAIILEELYYLKQKQARFVEIPITLTARSTGRSSFVYRPSVFVDYLKYPLKSLAIRYRPK